MLVALLIPFVDILVKQKAWGAYPYLLLPRGLSDITKNMKIQRSILCLKSSLSAQQESSFHKPKDISIAVRAFNPKKNVLWIQ